MSPPRATLRLQLHSEFSLYDAAEQLPYYARLGVSHLYLSPITVAVPGSTHGYDVIDPQHVNPEIGGEEAFRYLAEQARNWQLGLIVDIVSNHMAAHPNNPWWWDVLRQGRGSPYSDWFDIEWHAPGCERKVWLPILEYPCAEMLERRAFRVEIDDRGTACLEYGAWRFPLVLDGAFENVTPWRHWAAALHAGGAEAVEKLGMLLERQHYRLAWHRTASARINYRRFFDITGLVAIRLEREDVFEAIHALPLRFTEAGWIDGVRIDHIDGLSDPRQYLRRLRRALDAKRPVDVDRGQVMIYVEKILTGHEKLRDDWSCEGTTGYDFMDQVSGVLHDPAGQRPLCRLWSRESGRSERFDDEEMLARAEKIVGPLWPEFDRCIRALQVWAQQDAVGRELPRRLWERGLAALLREFRAYRTYAGTSGLDAVDEQQLSMALERVQDMDPALRATTRMIGAALRGETSLSAAQRRYRSAFVRRFEQLSAPLAAKAIEDNAFYRYGVLLSRNEVGSHPTCFSLAPAQFHEACRHRWRHHRQAMLATATHDHKRGEDLRMRLAVLSECPDWWTAQVEAFSRLALRQCVWMLGGDPSPGDRAMLWQTLVAAWPLRLNVDDRVGLRDYANRICAWQIKAVREAGLRSSWHAPNASYERAVTALIEETLLTPEATVLRHAIADAAAVIGPAGALNGLVQVALKLTVPGVPDLYQGTEDWDLSLVDPDNRRPVDYRKRQAWQSAASSWERLMLDWRTGQIKAYLISQLLQLRQRDPELFRHGDYRPMECTGRNAEHVLAFQREYDGRSLCVVVPRLTFNALGQSDIPMIPATYWSDTVLHVPGRCYREVLAGIDHLPSEGCLRLSNVLVNCPVAVLANP